MNVTKNILVCPLEWGLGHAGRMIPLVAKLREKDHNLFIGTGHRYRSFFEREMQGLNYIDFPGYSPSYSRFLPQWLKLLADLPVMLFHIIREHSRLKKIIRDHSIDVIISDNRFGLWNRKITSVYVTHMLRIPFPRPFSFLEFIGILLHRAIIRRYSLCFIPDLRGETNLSGRLSHGIKMPDNVRYIGILSRFTCKYLKDLENPVKGEYNTVILTGPEPQKSIFREIISGIPEIRKSPVVFLGGEPADSPAAVQSGNTVWFSHLDSSAMKAVIVNSRSIITRSGYSSIMELVSLGCSALLVPTPGQTEQEYLAGRLSAMGWFTSMSQKELRKGILMPSGSRRQPDEIIAESGFLLENSLAEMLKQTKE